VHLYLDSNVFIAALESSTELGNSARRALLRIAQRELTAVTGELTIAEVLPRLFAEETELLISAHSKALTSGGGLEVIAVTREILVQGAKLRAALKVGLPDAIHVATAVLNDCAAIVTEDRRLKAPAGISILRLGDEALQ
jgi:predicted nucleic acid-binding protein